MADTDGCGKCMMCRLDDLGLNETDEAADVAMAIIRAAWFVGAAQEHARGHTLRGDHHDEGCDRPPEFNEAVLMDIDEYFQKIDERVHQARTS
jgi:hypothetical protein